MRALVVLLIMFISLGVKATELEITLHSGNKFEVQGKKLIEGFLKTYDLSKYIFTKKIFIQSRVIPHSHPVLTLNTRNINEPDVYLALFLHEEIHWFFSNHKKETDKFVLSLKKEFPNVPIGKNSGSAETEFSAYLHFGVCYYEYLALSEFIGETKVTEIFKKADVYSWIKQKVLEDSDKIRDTLVQNDLVL